MGYLKVNRGSWAREKNGSVVVKIAVRVRGETRQKRCSSIKWSLQHAQVMTASSADNEQIAPRKLCY